VFHILSYDYVPDILDRRGPHRERHLGLARAALERGELVMAGAVGDPVDGAVFIFRGDDAATVEAFVGTDPYVEHGLVTRWQIRPYAVVVGG
jgi:uncharacterized protein YciI